MNLLDNPSSFAEEYVNTTREGAGWLSVFAEDYMAKARENLQDEIQRELEINFPPRNARSFRVIVVKDSQWCKSEPLRRAQITIWDVLRITHTEGGRAGHFEAGQRFLVTNLYPTKQGAWMRPAVGAEVYMSTRRDTTFTKLKS